MSSPRVVVFDLGNVLIEWDRRNLFEKLIDDPIELQDFLDNVFTMEDNARLDRGTPLHEVASEVASRHPDKHDLVMAFAQRWVETLGGVIDGTVEVLDDLHARAVPLYALSNWGKDTFAMIEHEYPFFAHFDAMVISGREGIVKPDPGIFDLLCERHGFAAHEAVFVDDSVANIATAASMGFDALLFSNPALLRQQLIERQLL